MDGRPRLALKKKRELLACSSKRKMSLRKNLEYPKLNECRLEISQVTKCVFIGSLYLKPLPHLFDSPKMLDDFEKGLWNDAEDDIKIIEGEGAFGKPQPREINGTVVKSEPNKKGKAIKKPGDAAKTRKQTPPIDCPETIAPDPVDSSETITPDPVDCFEAVAPNPGDSSETIVPETPEIFEKEVSSNLDNIENVSEQVPRDNETGYETIKKRKSPRKYDFSKARKQTKLKNKARNESSSNSAETLSVAPEIVNVDSEQQQPKKVPGKKLKKKPKTATEDPPNSQIDDAANILFLAERIRNSEGLEIIPCSEEDLAKRNPPKEAVIRNNVEITLITPTKGANGNPEPKLTELRNVQNAAAPNKTPCEEIPAVAPQKQPEQKTINIDEVMLKMQCIYEDIPMSDEEIEDYRSFSRSNFKGAENGAVENRNGGEVIQISYSADVVADDQYTDGQEEVRSYSGADAAGDADGGAKGEAKVRRYTKRQPKCKICSQIFATYMELNNHKRSHDGEKPYLCPKCSQNHQTLDQLIAHLRIHQGKRPYVCKKCNKGFKTTKALEEHQPVHVLRKVVQPKKVFACEICSKVFPKLCELERHTRVHTGEKPSICNICNRRFQQAHNLNKHLLIHTKEKPFQCDICNKKFGRNDVLNRHLLTHSVDKPNHCTVCMKSFIRLSQLMAHMDKYHSKLQADSSIPS